MNKVQAFSAVWKQPWHEIRSCTGRTSSAKHCSLQPYENTYDISANVIVTEHESLRRSRKWACAVMNEEP
jgi:hypothetical protein